MISSLYSEGARSLSVMLAESERIGCQTSAHPVSSLRARSSDPETSKQAAANASAFAGSHCDRILAALEKLGSGTAQEIGRECGLSVEQCDRRLPELQRAGKARVLELNGKPLVRDGYRVWGLAA